MFTGRLHYIWIFCIFPSQRVNMNQEKKIKLKIGDVYLFQWNQEQWDKQSYNGSLNHCFEGLLVVMEGHTWNRETEKYDKGLMLIDTYWGVNREENNKRFSLKEAQEKGSLEYYCNLNEIEEIKNYNLDDYADEDLFRLHDQHACVERCVYWYKKRGAKKSPQKKIEVLRGKINKEKSSIEYSVRSIECMSAEIKKLEINGFEENE